MPKTAFSSAALLLVVLALACSGKNLPGAPGGSGGAGGALGGGSAGVSGTAGVSGSAGDGAQGGTNGASGATGASGVGAAGSSGAGAAGSGGAAGTGAAGGGALAHDLFPLADGGTIVSRHNGGQGMWDETTTVTSMTYMGKPAFQLVGSPDPGGDSTTTILFIDGTRTDRATKDISNGGKSTSTTTYTPGFLRFDSAWSKLAVGAIEMHSYTRVYTPAGGSSTSSTSEHKYTIQALDESVTVVAGKFDHCMRVLRERVLQPGVMPMSDDIKTYWFCPGVGKVKEVAPNASSTEELVSCNLAGGACP